MADDDEDDRMLAKEAFEENKLANDLFFVKDGEELMDFLLRQGPYTLENAPRPDIILLDINMPRKNGIQALQEIKSNAELKKIPVIILTTSNADEDIVSSYELGVNSFITKPVTFDQLVQVVANLGNYWFKIVKLPK
ncbi:response regulator [bacterium]|nr:response regulator [bacterium]